MQKLPATKKAYLKVRFYHLNVYSNISSFTKRRDLHFFHIFNHVHSGKAKDPAVKALIAMFYNHEELARFEEKKTDAILEGENVEKPQNNASQKVHEEFIEETISMCKLNS